MKQVVVDLFPGAPDEQDKQRLNTVARFDPTVNELFFAKHVVLTEEFSAVVAIERAAEVMGIFRRHPRVRREVSLIDCNGKGNIPGFLRILNAFDVPYRVLHDEDPGNATAMDDSLRIAAEVTNAAGQVHEIRPDLEGLLGYVAPRKNKPLVAIQFIDSLEANGTAIPIGFQEAVCMAYFGNLQEPAQ